MALAPDPQPSIIRGHAELMQATLHFKTGVDSHEVLIVSESLVSGSTYAAASRHANALNIRSGCECGQAEAIYMCETPHAAHAFRPACRTFVNHGRKRKREGSEGCRAP